MEQTRPNAFDNSTFDQLMLQYNRQQTLPSSVDLTQAFLMTSNMTAAANTHMASAQFNTTTDFLAGADSLAGSMLHMSRLMQGLGPSDKSSNFFIAQKQFMEAQSKEDADIRQAINEEIVDGLAYVRMKEQICLTKQRASLLLKDDSDSDNKETSAWDSDPQQAF
jgi:hypothetical protein